MELMSGSGDDGSAFNVTEDLICAARSIQEPPAPLPYSEALVLVVKVYLALIFYSTFIAGTVLNIFVLFLVIRYKKLHTLTFGISLQIVMLNLIQLYGAIIFRLVTVITETWVLGIAVCVISGCIFHTVYNARGFLMCVFVIDRFLSIFAPYFYPRHSKKLIIPLCVTFCVISFLLQLLLLPGLLDCYSFSPTQGLCFLRGCSNSCSIFGRVYFILVLIPTTLIPVVLYAVLYCKVKKIKRTDNVVAPVGEDGRSAARDWKAAITFFLLFLNSFLLTTTSVGITIVLGALLSRWPSPILYILTAVSTSTTSLVVVADPIVIMRHSDVKEVLREIKTKLCGRCGSQRGQNQGTGEADRGQNQGTGEVDRGQNQGTGEADRDQNQGTGEVDRGQNQGTGEAEQGQNQGTGEADRDQNQGIGEADQGQNQGTGEVDRGQNQETGEADQGQNQGTGEADRGQNQGTGEACQGQYIRGQRRHAKVSIREQGRQSKVAIRGQRWLSKGRIKRQERQL